MSLSSLPVLIPLIQYSSLSKCSPGAEKPLKWNHMQCKSLSLSVKITDAVSQTLSLQVVNNNQVLRTIFAPIITKDVPASYGIQFRRNQLKCVFMFSKNTTARDENKFKVIFSAQDLPRVTSACRPFFKITETKQQWLVESQEQIQPQGSGIKVLSSNPTSEPLPVIPCPNTQPNEAHLPPTTWGSTDPTTQPSISIEYNPGLSSNTVQRTIMELPQTQQSTKTPNVLLDPKPPSVTNKFVTASDPIPPSALTSSSRPIELPTRSSFLNLSTRFNMIELNADSTQSMTIPIKRKADDFLCDNDQTERKAVEPEKVEQEQETDGHPMKRCKGKDSRDPLSQWRPMNQPQLVDTSDPDEDDERSASPNNSGTTLKENTSIYQGFLNDLMSDIDLYSMNHQDLESILEEIFLERGFETLVRQIDEICHRRGDLDWVSGFKENESQPPVFFEEKYYKGGEERGHRHYLDGGRGMGHFDVANRPEHHFRHDVSSIRDSNRDKVRDGDGDGYGENEFDEPNPLKLDNEEALEDDFLNDEFSN